MVRKISFLIAALMAWASQPGLAQQIAYLDTAVLENLEPASASLPPAEFAIPAPAQASGRFVHSPAPAIPTGIARFGAFRVIDEERAALVDITSIRSPAHFVTMMKAFPGIKVLEMIECPGTDDDRANLTLGRLIREHGLVTHVPAGGSVRSGAVELFLAGVRRFADDGAEFAVHSWLDDRGLEPDDYASTAPENRAYIDYYQQMGMSTEHAAAFYAMTNSVPNSSARWLNKREMDGWVRLDRPAGKLDSALALN